MTQRLQRAWRVRGGLATALLPLAGLFGFLSGLDRALFRMGIKASLALPVPVIVVGNLIVGGAGKTPTVMAIVALMRRHGFTPGIVSRGHGRADAATTLEVLPDTPVALAGDEPLLMRLRTGAPVFVSRDRVAAGRELLRRHPRVDVIVADDGLQHRRLVRDVQVLVFDERGVGNGWLLPAGPLRERLPDTVPPRSLVLYNASAPSTPLLGSVAQRSLARFVELADWRAGRGTSPLDSEALHGRPLVAAAGLAHPERFFTMLRGVGLSIVPLPLPDHFDYATLPWPPGTAEVVMTEKDAVKLDPRRLGSTRVWVAALDFRPAAAFDSALLALLPCAPATRPTEPDDHGNAPS